MSDTKARVTPFHHSPALVGRARAGDAHRNRSCEGRAAPLPHPARSQRNRLPSDLPADERGGPLRALQRRRSGGPGRPRGRAHHPHHRRGLARHRHRDARQAPAQRRLLRHRALPHHRIPERARGIGGPPGRRDGPPHAARDHPRDRGAGGRADHRDRAGRLGRVHRQPGRVRDDPRGARGAGRCRQPPLHRQPGLHRTGRRRALLHDPGRQGRGGRGAPRRSGGWGYNRSPMNAALAGLLVADLTQNVAGPYCTQILGDMGAEVVKVERIGRGDDARAWGPPFWGRESATFMSVNRNKRSLAVDLKSADGRAVLERLLARADVFVQSLRAGAAEELDLGWPRLSALNPRLVYCSVTAFGTEGPLKDRPGYDPLMQAYGGIMSINGHPGQPPARVPVSVVDMGTGMWGVMGILAALRERDRTGHGALVTTALFDTALAWSVFQMSHYFATGEVPLPQGSGTAMIVPYEAFPVSDGWVMIAAASDALFVKATGALGVPELARDGRFVDNPRRVEHRAALQEALARVTRGLTAADVLDRLQRAGVPSARVSTMDQVAGEPQTEASGMLPAVKHPRVADFRAVALPIKWDGERPAPTRVPPLLGEHSTELLVELGYDAATIRDLAERHVVQL